MRKIILLLALSVSAWGQFLKDLSITSTAETFTIASGTAQPTVRIEMRAIAAASQTWLTNGTLTISLDGSYKLEAGATSDTIIIYPNPPVLASAQDVRIRVQRDGVSGVWTMETWSGACANYQFAQYNVVLGMAPITIATSWTVGPNITTSFVRAYSTTDYLGDCPIDAPSTIGNLFDFTFENGSGGTNISRNTPSTMISTTGSSFTNSAVSYAPTAVMGGWRPARFVPGGFPLTTSPTFVSQSVSFQYPGDNSSLSYSWTKVSGPGTLTFGSATAASTTITAGTAGDYPTELTVTDGYGSNSITVDIGFVTVANGLVVMPSAEATTVIGPIYPYGTTSTLGGQGVQWFDVTWPKVVRDLTSQWVTPPPETTGAGSCSIPYTSGTTTALVPNVLGGDGFIHASYYGNVAVVCPSASFTSADNGNWIDLHWQPPPDSSAVGHAVLPINTAPEGTCPGSTCAVMLNNNYIIEPPSAIGNTSFAWGEITSANYSGGGGWGSGGWDAGTGNYNLNFYEAGSSIIRLAMSTGLTEFYNTAHSFCTNWYRYSLDSGYNSSATPRAKGINVMFLCAEDPTYTQPPGFWSQLANLIPYSSESVPYWNGSGYSAENMYNPTVPPVEALPDAREASYSTTWNTVLAHYGNSHGLTAATYCVYLKNQVDNFWIANVNVPEDRPTSGYAYWSENLSADTTSFVTAAIPPVTGTFGGSPWRALGLPMRALIYAYFAFSDASGGCHDAMRAAELFKGDGTGLIERGAKYLRDYGPDPSGGVYANLMYGSCQASIVASCAGNTAGTGIGTLSAVMGQGEIGNGNITGVGTSFLSQLTVGMYISPQLNYYYGGPYLVTAVTDNTHINITPNFTFPTQTGIVWYYATPAPTACGPVSIAATCEPDQTDGRSLAADISYPFSWLYSMTGSSSYFNSALFFLSKDFGGPASGAGFLGVPTGVNTFNSGTINLINGSTAITGVGTHFTSQFTSMQYLTVGSGALNFGWYALGVHINQGALAFYTVQISTVNSDTSITLVSNYPGVTENGNGFFYNAVSSTWLLSADGGTNNFPSGMLACSPTNPPPCNVGAPSNYAKTAGNNVGSGGVVGAIAMLMEGFAQSPLGISVSPSNGVGLSNSVK